MIQGYATLIRFGSACKIQIGAHIGSTAPSLANGVGSKYSDTILPRDQAIEESDEELAKTNQQTPAEWPETWQEQVERFLYEKPHEPRDSGEVLEEQQDESRDGGGSVLHGEIESLGEAKLPSEAKRVDQGSFLAWVSSDGTSEPAQDPSVGKGGRTRSTPLKSTCGSQMAQLRHKNTWDCISEANESGRNEDKSDSNSESGESDDSDGSTRGDESGMCELEFCEHCERLPPTDFDMSSRPETEGDFLDRVK